MNSLKKNLPLMIAVVLGVLITYLVMSLNRAREDLKKVNAIQVEASAPVLDEAPDKEEKHWIEERIEQEGAATEQRIKEQEAEGDTFKNQFEKFAE